MKLPQIKSKSWPNKHSLCFYFLKQEKQEHQRPAPSSLHDEGADFPRQCVEDQNQEERQDEDDQQGYDVLLVILPDEEDKGLHWVDEPVEAGGGTAGEKIGDSMKHYD